MGLDNIPKVYPCKKENTAIVDTLGNIDCKATQEAKQCPYVREFISDPLLKDTNATYGMFGLDCWYRGKYGNYLLSILDGEQSAFHESSTGYSFYGHGFDDGSEGINPDDCLTMHEIFVEETEEFAHQAYMQFGKEEAVGLIKDWVYASWWLKFIGNYGDGSEIWY